MSAFELLFCGWIIFVYNPLFWSYFDVCIMRLDNMFGVWTIWLNALNFIFWFLLWRWSYYDSIAFARKRKYMPWMYYVIKWLKWWICHVRLSWIGELMLWHSCRAILFSLILIISFNLGFIRRGVTIVVSEHSRSVVKS